ncbi:hypothetical protein J1N35_034007 [Gossypium stocksii]|uniref:Aminotransferase-like plant mobile domain-containing protein n=1 Tax=Gossypium stocksii TaxID=47602 RepID=A0A9D3ZQ11_9ROSI|nr:hypothetical protein J1N35_034007 [Gossypium stocksii]
MALLRRNFGELDEDLAEVEREQHTRAYILMIIGGILLPDKSRSLVHLRWMLKLVNFKEVGELSWGYAVLATFYREMCWVAQPRKIKISGCMLLLQSWARYRLPFYVLKQTPTHSHLWNHGRSCARLMKEVRDIQLLLDQRSKEEESDRVLWQFEFRQSIPVAP